MTFLPIVERELRVRARRKSTYRFRLFAASTAILLVTLLLLASTGAGTPGALGHGIFQLLTWLCFLFCLVEGPRNTSDALSQEKREGTLGLLFLTDLRSHDIVLGKLAATSLNSVYGLFAVFPPLAIPLVLGGVTGGEFWRTVLALVNALFLSLCLGLGISAASRDERKTWAYSSSLTMLVTIGPPFLLLIPHEVISTLGSLSPATAVITAREDLFLAAPGRYWNSILFVHGLSWFLLIVAAFLLPRSWQDRPVMPVRRHQGRSNRPPPGVTGAPYPLRDSQPVAWLASRQLPSNGMLWALVITASAVFVVSWPLGEGNVAVALVLFVAMYLLHLTLAIWLASDACHLFGAARDSGALELLLSTPLTDREIVLGHALGLKRQFLRPVAMLVGVELLLASAHIYLQAVRGSSLGACFLFAGIVVFLLFVTLLDLRAVASYGMWMGLTNQRPARAVTLTVLHVIILPMLALTCYPLYPVIGMVKNLVFINYGRDQLRRHFRTVVTERFEPSAARDLVGAAQGATSKHPLPPVLPR